MAHEVQFFYEIDWSLDWLTWVILFYRKIDPVTFWCILSMVFFNFYCQNFVRSKWLRNSSSFPVGIPLTNLLALSFESFNFIKRFPMCCTMHVLHVILVFNLHCLTLSTINDGFFFPHDHHLDLLSLYEPKKLLINVNIQCGPSMMLQRNHTGSQP